MEEEKDEIYRVFEYKDNNPILLLETADKVEAVEFILSNYSRDTLEDKKVHVELQGSRKWKNIEKSVDKLVNIAISKVMVREKGFVMPYLHKKYVKIIELEKKSPKSYNLKEIKRNVEELGLFCIVPANETKNIGAVGISRDSFDEFMNNKRLDDKYDYQAHYSIIFGLKEIIKSSEIVEIHPDRIKKDNKRSLDNGDNGNNVILRVYSAVKFKNEEKIYSAKLLLKHSVFEKKEKSLYTYEVKDVNISLTSHLKQEIEPLQRAPFPLETRTPQLLLMDSISLANLLKDFNKECDKGKKILKASKESEKLLIEPGNNILKEYLRQNNFLDRETQEKIVNDKGTHITTNVDTRLDSEIETIKDKLESLHEDQEESNTKSVRRRR